MKNRFGFALFELSVTPTLISIAIAIANSSLRSLIQIDRLTTTIGTQRFAASTGKLRHSGPAIPLELSYLKFGERQAINVISGKVPC